MHYEPRNPEADAQFIKAGGLKSRGGFALLLAGLILLPSFLMMHVLLTMLLGVPAAWWASLILFVGIVTGAVSLWIKSRRRQRVAQAQAWQRALRH